MTENNILPPSKIAFVLDGKVIELLHADERMASVFLSGAQIIDATNFVKNNSKDIINNSLVGWEYDGFTFTKP
jgi:hypothetical protein